MAPSNRAYRLLLAALCCLSLWGCRQDEPATSHIIVEGWIEAGEHPMVMIHRSCPYSQIDTAYNSIEDLVEDYLIPFGKVTVSDGDTTVVLTGRINRDYMPPYTYSSVYIKGEEGKTYYLTAQYGDFYATARTTIPPRTAFDSIRTGQQPGNRLSITGYLNRAPARTHYLVFARYMDRKQYLLCPLGVITTPDSVSDMQINIYNPAPNDEEKSFDKAFFPCSDSTGIYVKLATINDEDYAFWESFSALSLTSGILFIPMRQNIASNIHGGIGYWCGMGSTEHYVPLSHPGTYTYPPAASLPSLSPLP